MDNRIAPAANQLNKIKMIARNLVLAIGQDEKRQELHEISLDLLLELAELERLLTLSDLIQGNEIGQSTAPACHSISTSDHSADEIDIEIRKVERKLHRWARKQNQINSKILNLFLTLKNDGGESITEDILTEKYGNYGEFSRNYNQMKIISPKNHAKVFEVKNGIVEIWEPVRPYIEKYERDVFSNFT